GAGFRCARCLHVRALQPARLDSGAPARVRARADRRPGNPARRGRGTCRRLLNEIPFSSRRALAAVDPRQHSGGKPSAVCELGETTVRSLMASATVFAFLVLATSLAATPSFGGTITNVCGKFSFWVPDDWKESQEKSGIEQSAFASADGNLY